MLLSTARESNIQASQRFIAIVAWESEGVCVHTERFPYICVQSLKQVEEIFIQTDRQVTHIPDKWTNEASDALSNFYNLTLKSIKLKNQNEFLIFR
jgi:hypothetical protein